MTRPRKKSRRYRDSNPGPPALEADALTTRPTRRCGQKRELVKLVNHLEEASKTYGMQISAEKTQLMRNNTNGISIDINIDVDHNSIHWKNYTGTGDEMFPQTPRYLIQRSHNQWGSESQNWKRHRAVWRPPDFNEKTQTEVVRADHTIIWTGQYYPTGNSSRREMKRQTEETMGRQHQRVD